MAGYKKVLVGFTEKWYDALEPSGGVSTKE